MTSPDLSRSPNRPKTNTAAVQRLTSEVQQEEVRQLNIRIPAGMHRQLRRRALDEDIDLRELCIRVFEEYLGEGR